MRKVRAEFVNKRTKELLLSLYELAFANAGTQHKLTRSVLLRRVFPSGRWSGDMTEKRTWYRLSYVIRRLGLDVYWYVEFSRAQNDRFALYRCEWSRMSAALSRLLDAIAEKRVSDFSFGGDRLTPEIEQRLAIVRRVAWGKDMPVGRLLVDADQT